jgi:hypothetical protein
VRRDPRLICGRDVDADDYEGFIGPRMAERALAVGAAGLLFGPPGAAAGLVAGGIAGGLSTEHSGPKLRNAPFDKLRSEVLEGSSPIIRLASPEHVDAMVEALEAQGAASSGAAWHPERPTRWKTPSTPAPPQRKADAPGEILG